MAAMTNPLDDLFGEMDKAAAMALGHNELRTQAEHSRLNEVRDQVQDLCCDAYWDLNILCFSKALSTLESAVEILKKIAP